MVVSDGLRSTLIRSKFQNFPGGACPQTPLTVLCTTTTANRALSICPPISTLCPPPSLISGSAPGDHAFSVKHVKESSFDANFCALHNERKAGRE